MDITAGFSAIRTGFELLKGLRELLRKRGVAPAEIEARLLELSGLLLDAQAALSDAQEEVRTARVQLAEEASRKATEADMQYESDGGFYVRESQRLAGLDIRYCPVCWNKDRKTIPLATAASPGLYECPIDTTSYKTKEYERFLGNISGRRSKPGSWMGG